MSGVFSILRLQRDGDSLRAEIEIPAESRWFAGHFPGAPILPAIAHFDLVCQVHRAGGGTDRLVGLDRVRLVRPVRPGEQLVLTLEAMPKGTGRFTLRTVHEEAVSDGVLRWADAPGSSA